MLEESILVGKGLIEIDGDYYYVRSNGELAIGIYYVTRMNGYDFTEGWYNFDANGAMTEDVNGIVRENDGLYYYENNLLVGKGLMEIENTYFYVKSNGQLATGRYYITRTNGYDVEVGWYDFDETTGAMIS